MNLFIKKNIEIFSLFYGLLFLNSLLQLVIDLEFYILCFFNLKADFYFLLITIIVCITLFYLFIKLLIKDTVYFKISLICGYILIYLYRIFLDKHVSNFFMNFDPYHSMKQMNSVYYSVSLYIPFILFSIFGILILRRLVVSNIKNRKP